MAEKKIIKKQTGVRIDVEVLKSVKHLAVDTGLSVSALMTEAAADLLKKYSKSFRIR